MEQIIKVLIFIHASFGGIALLAGFVSIVAKKGQTIHKKSGLVFYYAMLTSAVMAILISLLPKHESPFLFAVGIFSMYFVLTGYRALRFKSKNPKLIVDQWISRIMIITGVLMIILPLFIEKSVNIVLLVFAIIGILFSVRDILNYRHPEKLKSKWLKLHLGKMTGGYIASVTAFVIVNDFFPSIYGWFIPGIIGGIFITYWIRKINNKIPPSKTKLGI